MHKHYAKVVVTLVGFFVLFSLFSSVHASFYDRIKERSDNPGGSDSSKSFENASHPVNSDPSDVSSVDDKILKPANASSTINKKAQGITVQSKGALEGNVGDSLEFDAVIKADSNTSQ